LPDWPEYVAGCGFVFREHANAYPDSDANEHSNAYTYEYANSYADTDKYSGAADEYTYSNTNEYSSPTNEYANTHTDGNTSSADKYADGNTDSGTWVYARLLEADTALRLVEGLHAEHYVGKRVYYPCWSRSARHNASPSLELPGW
jgi:hypothetical protein